MTEVGAKLKRLSQGNSTEDGQHGTRHTRGEFTDTQVMVVDQSDDLQRVGTSGEEETEPQAIEAKQNDTQVNVSPVFLVRTMT